MARLGWFVALVMCGSLAASAGCNGDNKKWQGAQASAEKRAEAKEDAEDKGEAPKAAEGGTLNKFFPPADTDGMVRTFDQEKDGFVQAKLKKGATEATLSISDLVQNEEARKKFDTATEKLGDDPVTTVGKNQTTAMIAKRWQIKVSSQQLDHPARKALLEKFDLTGLRAFNPPPK